MTFADSSGWFALYVPTDPHHLDAARWKKARRRPLITTDYVIDETLTLMRARGEYAVALDFGDDVFNARLGEVHYLTPAEIAAAWDVFRRYADKEWSFTDCTCKVVIEAAGVPEAFTFDHHFRQFGTVAVVP